MTNAFNLSQLANNTNSSGQISLGTGVAGTLPVVSGGTGVATLTANSVLVGAGTSAVTGIAAGTSGNVLTSNGTNWASSTLPPDIGLGIGQVWSFPVRSLGTTYTNSTGKPISVSVSVGVNVNFVPVILTIGGIQSCKPNVYSGAVQVTGIVPNGSTYSMNSSNLTLAGWAELS